MVTPRKPSALFDEPQPRLGVPATPSARISRIVSGAAGDPPTPQPPRRRSSRSGHKSAIRELMQGLCSDDPYDHRCAAELARLVSRRQPGVLAQYADLLAAVAAEFPPEEWQARGYVLVAAALNATTPAQRERLMPLIRARLAEDRIAVRAMALEAFATLAAHEPDLRDEAMDMLEQHRHSTDPAMRARARMMLPILMRADTRPQH